MYQAEPSLRREVLAADAAPDARVDFIRKTYLHLGGAVLAFIGLEALFLRTPAIYEPMLRFASGGRYNWLIVIGVFMLVGYVAQKWAMNSRSLPMQYAGLALYVLIEALIFVPLLFIVTYYAQFDGILTQAAMITAIVFGGMTAIVFLSKKDFSFMGPFLGVAMMVEGEP